MPGRSPTKEGPVLPPRMLFAGLASPCGEILLLFKQNTPSARNGPLWVCKGPQSARARAHRLSESDLCCSGDWEVSLMI